MHPTVVVPQPTSFTAQRPVIELSQHVKLPLCEWWPQTDWTARTGCGPPRCRRRCRHHGAPLRVLLPHPCSVAPEALQRRCRSATSARRADTVRSPHRRRPAPTTRRRAPCPAGRALSSVRGAQSVSSPAVTCGVSIPIWRTGRPDTAASAWALASRSAKSSPRWSMTVKEPSRSRMAAAAARVVQVAGHRDDPGCDRGGGHGVEGVQQRGGGDVGGGVVAERRRQPGFGQPRDRRLRHHQHGHRNLLRWSVTKSPSRSRQRR